MASRLPSTEWPDKQVVMVALYASTGELALFDRQCGVDLVDAVMASNALPGLVPTVSINGDRYIDGGVRSPDNSDLAPGVLNRGVLEQLFLRAVT